MPPPSDTHEGEVINSMRLSEARLLLSRYKRNIKKNGAAVASTPALAVDVKDLAPDAVAEGCAAGGAGLTGTEEATTGGAGDEVAVTASPVAEQGLMKLVEKAVMALTEVRRRRMSRLLVTVPCVFRNSRDVGRCFPLEFLRSLAGNKERFEEVSSDVLLKGEPGPRAAPGSALCRTA